MKKIIGVFFLILLIILGCILIFVPKYQYGYSKSITDVCQQIGLTIHDIDFATSGEVFYVYKRSLDGRDYLRIYGFMSLDNVAIFTEDSSYRIVKTPQMDYVFLDDEVPENLISKMNIEKNETSSQYVTLHSDNEGFIWKITKVTQQYYFQLTMSDSSGAFILRIISPPRMD